MPKYFVELSVRYYFDAEIEADDEAAAIDLAIDEADEEIRWESLDWDVDYIERLNEDEAPAVQVDKNQESLF